ASYPRLQTFSPGCYFLFREMDACVSHPTVEASAVCECGLLCCGECFRTCGCPDCTAVVCRSCVATCWACGLRTDRCKFCAACTCGETHCGRHCAREMGLYAEKKR